MKPGDLVQIRGNTVPMYPDRDWWPGRGSTSHHIGYARGGSTGILMASDQIGRGGNLTITFHLILLPGFGPVWIRGIWVYEVAS